MHNLSYGQTKLLDLVSVRSWKLTGGSETEGKALHRAARGEPL